MSSKQQKNNAFRAPPPSLRATGRGIKAAGLNNEILAEFLEQSLHIPDLIFPNPLLRMDISHQDLLAFDLLSLRSSNPKNGAVGGRLVQSAVDHGILSEIIARAEEECDQVFELPLGKKQIVCRSDDIRFGFEDIVGDAVEKARVHEMFWVDQNEDYLGRNPVPSMARQLQKFQWSKDGNGHGKGQGYC